MRAKLNSFLRSPATHFALALAVFAVAILASSRVGVPHNAKGQEALPAVALGWRLLFHVLRASALLGAVGLAGLVAWRGVHGDWPIKFANVEYAPKQTVEVTASAIDHLTERLDLLEGQLAAIETPGPGE